MTERLKYEGRLGVEKRKVKALELKMQGLRDSIRNILDPFEKLELIETDVAASQCVELSGLQIELKESLETIRALNKALGR